jgi:hypothetical protein
MVQEIGATLARVEAVTIQMVGSQEEEKCRCCKATGGPFVHYVRDPDTPPCGNCHWRGKPCSLTLEVADGSRRGPVLKRLSPEDIMATFVDRETDARHKASSMTSFCDFVLKVYANTPII